MTGQRQDGRSQALGSISLTCMTPAVAVPLEKSVLVPKATTGRDTLTLAWWFGRAFRGPDRFRVLFLRSSFWSLFGRFNYGICELDHRLV